MFSFEVVDTLNDDVIELEKCQTWPKKLDHMPPQGK